MPTNKVYQGKINQTDLSFPCQSASETHLNALTKDKQQYLFICIDCITYESTDMEIFKKGNKIRSIGLRICFL